MRNNLLKLYGGVAIVLLLTFTAGCAKEQEQGQEQYYAIPSNYDPEFTSVISTPGEAAYAKIICLENNGEDNGTLLVTYEQFERQEEGLVFPVYRSTDEGKSWEHISNVPCLEGEKNFKKWQPHIYELPTKVGDMEAGTILLAGNSFNDRETKFQLYKSNDLGESWEYISTIVTAKSFGEGVWEPNLIATDDGTLLCFFADETENQAHSQKLSYRSSKDGVTWSESVDVVALTDQSKRPGMPSVTRYYDGSYILAYEVVNEAGNPNYVSYSKDGMDWGNVTVKGNRAITAEYKDEVIEHYSIGCSPVLAWSPAGKDEKGTLVMSGMYMSLGQAIEGKSDYFVSYDGGVNWERIKHPIPYFRDDVREAYSNGMTFSNDGKKLYTVNTINDGEWKVVCAAIELQEIKAVG